MKIRIIVILAVALLLLTGAVGVADRSKYLAAALPFREEGNPFRVRYNEINGTEIRPLCPLGCPYFWGGRRVTTLLRPASPNSSSDYYKKNLKYLSGLDCVGFTRYINQKTGYENHPAISDMLNTAQYTEYLIRGAKNSTGEERASVLRIGDLVAMQHPSGGFHIAMVCGTLADYGYTAETLPEELRPYLHYPLVIHCTGSSDYYERYRDSLSAAGQDDVQPPFGGVIVSILDVPLSEATAATPDYLGLSAPCFDLEGYHLEILDLSAEKRVRWIRWRKRPEKN